ncbi:ABC transporter permease [Candidatus Bathyarchaeota archaeon]|nr:MAG: ABC transporter permease [Candidatus Bathyarchaeota archaeon]
MEYGKPAPRTSVLSLGSLFPSHLRSNRAIRPPSGRIADPYDDWSGRDPETSDQRCEYHGDLAAYRSAHSLYSHLVSASTTDPQLHGIPRKEGGKADPSMAVADFLKSARESFRVGWKIESNWTDPVLFATYQIIRPLASLLIVAFIVIIGAAAGAAGSAFYTQYLAWLIVGTAFYAYVLQVMLGMAILVYVDRNRYEVLKNIYISPGSLHPYVIGRGLVSVVNGTISVILTLLFSVAIFNGLLHMNIPLNLLGVNLLMLIPAVLLGITALLGIGYMLCAVNIVSNRMEFILGDSVSGVFFLLGGVIFSISLLPVPVQYVSNVLPVTYFLNTVRESFGLPTPGNYMSNLAILGLTTLAALILGISVFRLAERRAKRLGLFDRKSEY